MKWIELGGGHRQYEAGALDLIRPFEIHVGVIGPDLVRPGENVFRIIPRELSGEPHVESTRIQTQTIVALEARGLGSNRSWSYIRISGSRTWRPRSGSNGGSPRPARGRQARRPRLVLDQNFPAPILSAANLDTWLPEFEIVSVRDHDPRLSRDFEDWQVILGNAQTGAEELHQ